MAGFDQVATSLNAQVDQLEEQFVTDNADLTEEELNNLEESSEIDFEQPLADFESQYGITNSYRTVYNAAMDDWLAHETLDFSTSPSNNTLFDGAELSLLNEYQQVMVGDSLYHFTGTKYAIVADEYALAIDYVLDNPKARRFEGNLQLTAWWIFGDEPGCTLWRKEGIEPYETSDRLIATYAGIRSVTVYSKFLAGVKSYKKKNNGNWKRYRTNLEVRLSGHKRDIECENVGVFEIGYKHKTRKKLQANTTIFGDNWGGNSYRAQNGTSVHGEFNYHGTFSAYTLEW